MPAVSFGRGRPQTVCCRGVISTPPRVQTAASAGCRPDRGRLAGRGRGSRPPTASTRRRRPAGPRRPGHRRVPRRAPSRRRRVVPPLQLRRRDGQPAQHVHASPPYDAQDTYQAPATSIANLDRLIRRSVSRGRPARGPPCALLRGRVASGWWETRAPAAIAPVQHIFTLDSPLNGIGLCGAAAVLFSPAVSDELCRTLEQSRRLRRNAHRPRQARDPDADRHARRPDPMRARSASCARRSSTSAPDPGSLRHLAVHRRAERRQHRSRDAAGSGAGVIGRTRHFAVIACPQTTRTILAGASPGLVVSRAAKGATAPRHPDDRSRPGDQGGLDELGPRTVARGTGLVRRRRRAIRLSRPRPCEVSARDRVRTCTRGMSSGTR